MPAKTETAYETWCKAGAAFADKCRTKGVAIIPLGEAAFTYAASRGLPHQDIIRRAFREGFYASSAD